MSETAWLVLLVVLAFIFRRRLVAFVRRLWPIFLLLLLLGLLVSGHLQPILNHIG